MNKLSRKVLIILCIAFIAGGVFLSFNIINKNKKISKEVEIQVDPKAREKSEDALLEDAVRNYRRIYVSLVNDKELDFSFLNNTIAKDSEIYNKVVEDIKTKRSSDIKLEDKNVDIRDIKETAEGYEVFTIITYAETVKGNAKTVTLEQKFKVSVQNNKITIKALD